jgi:hypothetical protein
MRFYYRALPNLRVPHSTRNVRYYRFPFVWVKNIKQVSTDYLPAMQKTQSDLKSQHGLDTELVPVDNPKLMEQQYAIAVDTDEHRLEKQTIVEDRGIYTVTDELLTAQQPGVSTFDGFLEVLERNEDEAEHEDRK